MATSSVSNSFIILSAFILVCLVLNRRLKRSSKLPPGPPGWPIVGNLLDMPKEFEWLQYKKWSDLYRATFCPLSTNSGIHAKAAPESDIIHLNVLGTSIIVLSSLEAMNSLLKDKAAIYSDRSFP